jgi:hypothetical protein
VENKPEECAFVGVPVLWTRGGGGGHPIFFASLPQEHSLFYRAGKQSLFPITQHNPQHLLASLLAK